MTRRKDASEARVVRLSTEVPDLANGPVQLNPSRKRLRRWWKWLGLVVVALVLAVGFGPSLATRTSFRNQLIAWCLPELADRLTMADARIGWWTPLEIQNLTLLDAQQRKMIQVAKISSDRTLWDLALNPHSLGAVQIVQPTLQVVVRPDGCNLTDLASGLSGASETAAESSPLTVVQIRLQITEGQITVLDEVTGRVTKLANVDLGYQPSAEDVTMMTLRVAGRVDDGGEGGKFSSDVSWRPPKEWGRMDLGTGKVALVSTRFPLGSLKPLLLRVCPELDVQGNLSGTANGSWQAEAQGPVLHVTTDLQVDQPEVGFPPALGQDRLVDDQLHLQINGWLEHDYVRIEQADLKSRLLEANLQGSGRLASFLTPHLALLATDFRSDHRLACKGHLSIPQVAASLRETLRLQKDLSIREGAIDFDIQTESIHGVRAFQGSIATNRLLGQAQGREIAWNDPITVRWDFATTENGMEIREAQCDASFLKAVGKGDLEQGEFHVDASLDKLSNQIRRFCDFRPGDLAGSLTCQGKWQTAGQELAGTVDAKIEGLAWNLGDLAWREKSVVVHGSATAIRQGSTLVRIERGELAAEIGPDVATIAIREPIDQPWRCVEWPLRGEVRGQLDSWKQRLSAFVPAATTIDARGIVAARWDGSLSSHTAAVPSFSVEATDLQLHAGSIRIQEPKLVVEGQLEWNGSQDTLLVPQATLACSSVAARAQNVRVDQLSTSARVAGDVAFRGDIARLARCVLHAPDISLYPNGSAEGQLRLRLNDAQLGFQLTASARPLALSQRQAASAGASSLAGNWIPLWQEDQLTIDAKGSYGLSDGLVSLTNCNVQGDAVGMVSTGRIETPSMIANLEGEWNYDWDRLQPKLRSLLGQSVVVSGQQKQRFKVQGPLMAGTNATISPELVAEFGLGWTQLQAYGVATGPQQINARLVGGIVDIAPLDTTLYGGRLQIDPRIELGSNPIVLVLDRPAAVEQVQLTPDMLRSWLKYVTPLLADATTAQGRVSLQLSEARVPLLQPTLTTAMGRIVVEQANLAPGPLAQQFLGIFREVSLLANRGPAATGFLSPDQAVINVPPQQIDFQIAQGRIYHRNLEFRLKDLAIRTQGSVGLDQSLSLLAEVPIPESWIGQERLLQGLRGQNLQIPIQGSFLQPQIDSRALANLARDAVGSTAERMLQDEVQKGLQRLLGPK